jgi:D-3-phosphoglycerate dehydrogenase
MQLTERMAAIGRALLADQGARAIRRLALRVGADLAGSREALLASASIGVLGDVIENERLNLINARALAEQRGIELAVTEGTPGEGPRGLELTLSSGMKELYVAGVAAENAPPRLVRIGSFHVDVNPRQTLVILTNHDVPGVIGRVGTLLGEARVNIAEYHQARLAQGGEALAAVTVDGQVSEAIRQQLLSLPDVISATVANFRLG